jgi:hypothetical protein
LRLFASWVKRYSKDDQKFWKTLIDAKYNTPTSSAAKSWVFPFLERGNVGAIFNLDIDGKHVMERKLVLGGHIVWHLPFISSVL